MHDRNRSLGDNVAGRSVTLDIISTVTEAEGITPSELQTRLAEVINPDALEAVLQNSANEVSVRFEHHGRRIEVQSDGLITVSDPADE